MSMPSGFVPVPFHQVGRLVLAMGGAGLLLRGISQLTSPLSLPSPTLVKSMSAIVIGLYLILLVPREESG